MTDKQMTYKETLEKALKFLENKSKTYEGYSPLNTAVGREEYQKSADITRWMLAMERRQENDKGKKKMRIQGTF